MFNIYNNLYKILRARNVPHLKQLTAVIKYYKAVACDQSFDVNTRRDGAVLTITTCTSTNREIIITSS